MLFWSKVLAAGIMGVILVNKASPSSTLVRDKWKSPFTLIHKTIQMFYLLKHLKMSLCSRDISPTRELGNGLLILIWSSALRLLYVYIK